MNTLTHKQLETIRTSGVDSSESKRILSQELRKLADRIERIPGLHLEETDACIECIRDEDREPKEIVETFSIKVNYPAKYSPI